MADSTQKSALTEAVEIEKAVAAETKQLKGLSAEEVINHPGYASKQWELEPTKSGKTQVATGRWGGPFNIHWQIHGTGKTKIVFVMGLGALLSGWKRQTKHFGHQHGSEYSCLLFDNRGMGKSDIPTTRYSTSEMALDTIDVLKSVGWYDESAPHRDLNVIGISMGGMIAQEIAVRIPNHIQSLQLVSTAPRIVRTLPFIANLQHRISMFVPRQIDVHLEETAHRLFAESFLALPDTDDPDPKLNYPTIRDRFAAGELQKRADPDSFTRKGLILQALAAGWHYKSADQLQDMRDKVGPDRIMVVHGKEDRMITFPHFEMMRNDLGDNGITYHTWDNCGHIPLWEKENEFNELVTRMIRKTGDIP